MLGGDRSVRWQNQWLVHLNRRRDGAWTQRYRYGIPVTGLVPVDPDGSTGTTVRFLPDRNVQPTVAMLPRHLEVLTRWPSVAIDLIDQRPH
jgi:topoisomerase IV subunit B